MHLAGVGDVESKLFRHLSYACPDTTLSGGVKVPPVHGHFQVRQRFQYCVERWSKGAGHPPSLKGTVVATSEYDKPELSDPLFRAKMLVRFGMASGVFPLGSWSILV